MFVAKILSFPKAPPARVEAAHLEGALAAVDAALAVLDGDDRERWSEALRRFQNFMLWRRAVLMSEDAWQLASTTGSLEPVAPDDRAMRLASRVEGDGVHWVEAAPDWPLPDGLRGALLARRGPVTLYFELGEERHAPDEMETQLVFRVMEFLEALGPGTARLAPAAGSDLVGESGPMRAVFDLAHRHADSQAPVHIYGETGTGKERIAHALHGGSPRRGGPFVAVNAAAVSEELFESEFFGHVKGAFTGAVGDREGFVGLAQGGTLFIDEVADLSLRGQAKLLRFLEDGEYRRVGDSRTRRADVRILTASNVHLETRVAEGRFREDLLRRIDVLSLRLPPLRERHGDVELLGRHLLREAAENEKKALPRLGSSSWRALERYHWPGNVRELRAEMLRLVVEFPGSLVRPQDLASRITTVRHGVTALDAAIDAFERDTLRAALAECRSRTEAARRLGLSRQGLRGKMKRLGIA